MTAKSVSQQASTLGQATGQSTSQYTVSTHPSLEGKWTAWVNAQKSRHHHVLFVTNAEKLAAAFMLMVPVERFLLYRVSFGLFLALNLCQRSTYASNKAGFSNLKNMFLGKRYIYPLSFISQLGELSSLSGDQDISVILSCHILEKDEITFARNQKR